MQHNKISTRDWTLHFCVGDSPYLIKTLVTLVIKYIDTKIIGEETVVQLVRVFLRMHWPKAPEEFIVAAAERLHSNEALIEIGNNLGIKDLVRTKVF